MATCHEVWRHDIKYRFAFLDPPPFFCSCAKRHSFKTNVTKLNATRTEGTAEHVWNFAILPQPVTQANCGSSVAGVVDIGVDVAIHLFVQDNVTLVEDAASCTQKVTCK